MFTYSFKQLLHSTTSGQKLHSEVWTHLVRKEWITRRYIILFTLSRKLQLNWKLWNETIKIWQLTPHPAYHTEVTWISQLARFVVQPSGVYLKLLRWKPPVATSLFGLWPDCTGMSKKLVFLVRLHLNESDNMLRDAMRNLCDITRKCFFIFQEEQLYNLTASLIPYFNSFARQQRVTLSFNHLFRQ